MRLEEVTAKALEGFDNDRYKLSMAVAKRIEQLSDGALPLVNMDKAKSKLADIALYEFAQGKIALEGFVDLE